MKKIILTVLSAFFILSVGFSQKEIIIKLNTDKNNSQVKTIKDDVFSVRNSFSKIKLTTISEKKNGNFIKLSAQNLIKTFNKGNPDLPVYSRLIEVPQDAKVKLTVVSYDEEIINLSDKNIYNKIMPAQPSLRKDKDPEDVPFYYNEKVYKTDAFYSQGKHAVYEEAGQMRDVRLGRIEIRPFEYNPVTNQLKVLNNIIVKVEFIGADFTKTEALKRKYASPFFSLSSTSVIYKLQNKSKELIQYAPVTYVIVADRSFEAALQPFVQWKTMKGFKVIEAYTDDPNVGNTVPSIKAYLKNLYENPPAGQSPPSFILVVGDIDKVPATQHSEVADSPYSDLDLAEYTGDYLPEVNYGRWSADNADQVSDIVYKTVRYEKLQMNDISYLGETFLIAGDDEGNEDTYGGGAIYYADKYYANADHNIYSHTFLQSTIETWGGNSQGNAQAHDSIIADINKGVALANYTAHCSPDGWASPSFTRNDLNNYITNDDKYGLWIGNCCQSNKFDENEAFAELAIRKPNAGVIGYIGGSQYTYWDGDYFWGVGVAAISATPSYENSTEGCYDGLFHDKANEVNDISAWYETTYQFNKAGLLAVQASSATNKDYYWVIYQVAGDPSIMPFVGTPQPMPVTTSPAAIVMGTTSLNVYSAPYSYVALSQDGILIATAVSDASGNASLSFASDALSIGNADLVVTAQNRVPHIGTISVSPANEPYIALNSYTTSASPDYGQSITLNVTLENVAESGSGYDANNVNAVLSTSDSYISITDNTETYGTITAGDSLLINDAFAVTLANNIPDQHVISFNIAITADGGYSWNATLHLTANAPVISIGDLFVNNDDNADGRLDPGETGDINFTVTNNGHADADFGGTLSKANDPNNYLTLGGTTVAPVTITASGSQYFTFTGASADINTPLGSPVGLQLDVTAGASAQYSDVSNQDLIIGIIPIYPISDEGTLTVCTGTFYDSGLDTVDYGANENYTMTFMPGIGEDFVVVDFSSFDTESGYDYLYVYDGHNTSSPQIAGSPFTGTKSPGILTGANGLTFRFTSDSNTQDSGWVAKVSCFTPTTPPDCPTNPIPADAAKNVFPVQISWDASLGASSYDVYFGTDANPYTNTPITVTSPLYNISVNPFTTYYWAVLPTNSIGTGTGCDIWSFTTGSAQYLMTNGTFTTCNGVFYDTGGADNNYSSSENLTITFLPGTAGKMINADFTAFDTESGYDNLKIYDGNDASATLIGTFEGTGSPGSVTASNSNGALTFIFYSDGSVTKAGWAANISCVDSTTTGLTNINTSVSILPNPNNGLFTLKTGDINISNSKVEIYSMSGKLIYQKNINSDVFNIDLSNQAKGIYFVRIIFGNKIINSKLIIE